MHDAACEAACRPAFAFMIAAVSTSAANAGSAGNAKLEAKAAPAPPSTARRVGPVDWPIWRPMLLETRNIMIVMATRSTARRTKRAQSTEMR